MVENWRYLLRCHECGRFVKPSADYSVPFGGPCDLEPPPEQYYCESCSKRLEEHYVLSGWVPDDWLRANWQSRAAKRLNYKFRERG
jgi:hypothetical protein